MEHAILNAATDPGKGSPPAVRNRKFYSGCRLFLFLCLWLAPAFAPQPAHAYNFYQPPTVSSDGEVCKGDGFVERVVVCIKETVAYATFHFLRPFSEYLGMTIGACITLAVLLWGALMATGKTSAPVRDLAVMLVKIGAVVLFTTNFGGFYPLILDGMEGMLSVVTEYVMLSTSMNCPNATSNTSVIVWQRVDCAMQALIGGIFPTDLNNPWPWATIAGGIVGFIVACLFSGSVGLFIALLIAMLIVQLLFAVARSVYIFITAYIAFSLMVCISPMFIPLILFRVTKPYFDKWLRLTMGFILQPIFLFAYLSMLLVAFDTVVYSGERSLFRTIAGRSVDTDPNFRIGKWLYDGTSFSPIYAESSKAATGVTLDPGEIARKLGAPQNLDIAVTGVIGEQITTQKNWVDSMGRPLDIFSYLGVGKGGNDLRFFKVDIPTQAVSWDVLAMEHDYRIDCAIITGDPSFAGSDCPDTTAYLIDLFLSAIMALVIGYIFVNLLDYLPFIGSGISGEALSMPPFGVGNMAPPGNRMIKSLRKRLALGGGPG